MSTNKLDRYNNSLPDLFNRDEFLTPFSSMFDSMFNGELESKFDSSFFAQGSYPKVDIIDEATQITIEAEVPGLSKDQIVVEINNGVLQIKGEKQDNFDNSDKKKNYVHKELKKSSFCRSFSVGNNIDKEKLNAKFNNGILTITLPKIVPDPKKEDPKRIEIN